MMMGVGRGGGGHCTQASKKNSDRLRSEDWIRCETSNPAVWLIEVKCSPRRIIFLKPHNMVFEAFEPSQKRSGRRWHYNRRGMSHTLRRNGTPNTVTDGKMSLQVSKAAI